MPKLMCIRWPRWLVLSERRRCAWPQDLGKGTAYGLLAARVSALQVIGDGVAEGNLSRWRAVAGLDFHVLTTLLFRGWTVIAGAATVLVIPTWLSPTEQGYYYTFASVLALQIFFELGLSQVVVQLVSHEVAHLTPTADGGLAGDEARLGRLASLARLLRHWYLVAAALFALAGGAGGALFFASKGEIPMSQWSGVWVVLVGWTAMNLSYSPALAMLEGCGQVGEVARMRLLQSVLGYAVLWAVLFSGGGLWAATAGTAASALTTGYWLRKHGSLMRWLARRPFQSADRIAWRADVLPLQWRIAVSWISGYFILHLVTPMVFAHRGAVEAGQLGIAITVFAAVSTVGMSWVNAKAPTFTMHISRSERQTLNALFRGVLFRSVAFTAILSLLVLCAASVLGAYRVGVMQRIVGLDVLAWLATACVANSAIFAAATYMRAHREEPMLPVSVVAGIATAAAAYFGSKIGILEMVMRCTAVVVFLTLPWTLWLFMQYYRRPA